MFTTFIDSYSDHYSPHSCNCFWGFPHGYLKHYSKETKKKLVLCICMSTCICCLTLTKVRSKAQESQPQHNGSALLRLQCWILYGTVYATDSAQCTQGTIQRKIFTEQNLQANCALWKSCAVLPFLHKFFGRKAMPLHRSLREHKISTQKLQMLSNLQKFCSTKICTLQYVFCATLVKFFTSYC